MNEDQIKKALEKIIKIDGPHPRAMTNTAEHWRGVVQTIKDEISSLISSINTVNPYGLTEEQMCLIVDAGFDSKRRENLEKYHSDLCIYLLDKTSFDKIYDHLINLK